MSLDESLDVFRRSVPGSDENRAIRALDWVLRGVGQVVFQSNWLSGTIVLIAIGVNSIPYVVAAILGTVVSTCTALVFKVDRGLIDAGLLGFNGCLAGIGINFCLSRDFSNGEWPALQVYGLIVLAAAFSTIVMSAISSLLGTRSVPTLTAPFVFATWLMLFSVHAFTGFDSTGTLLTPGVPGQLTETAPYTFATFFNGTFKGVGEIFFQDNEVTGIIVVLGVLVNTRIGGLMCVGGSAVAALIAMAAGADEGAVNAGLYGFNASLTAIALGGHFFVFDKLGAVYALFGVVVTTFAWPAAALALAPIGMPTLTFPFVFTTWLFLIAKPGLRAVRAVAPPDATYPEDIYRRWKADELGPGL